MVSEEYYESIAGILNNATMESFYGSLKAELVYRVKFKTRKEAMNEVFEYIEAFYKKAYEKR